MPDLNEIERIQLQEQRRAWLAESRDKAQASAANATRANANAPNVQNVMISSSLLTFTARIVNAATRSAKSFGVKDKKSGRMHGEAVSVVG